METVRSTRFGNAAGKGAIRAIVSLAVVAALAYGAFKVIPPYAAAFQLDDEVREQVVLAGARRRKVSDAEIRSAILNRAAELGLAVDDRAIVIRRIGDDIRVEVEYTVRIEFPFEYHYDWTFQSEHEGPYF